MKSELKESTEQRWPNYPYLAKHNVHGYVVVFDSKDSATIVAGNNPKDLGYKSMWGEHNFTPLPPGSSVTLTQE